MMLENRIFRCNDKEVPEWCVAKDKHEAYAFMDKFWDDGAIMKKLYVNDFLKSNPGKTLDDFIESFFIEEDLNNKITISDAGINNESITKTVREWLEQVPSGPSYLCHEEWVG